MTARRLPPILPAEYTQAQRQAAAAFRDARNAEIFGPFEAMLHSPELMTLAQAMGEYLRYRSAIGTTLSELAILITARHWSQDYEWSVHAPIAERAGIAPATIAAIRDGRRPADLSEDEAAIYDVTTELQTTRRVSDATWSRAEARFGPAGLVDLVGIAGYYAFLAMQLNAARYPAPSRLPRFPD